MFLGLQVRVLQPDDVKLLGISSFRVYGSGFFSPMM